MEGKINWVAFFCWAYVEEVPLAEVTNKAFNLDKDAPAGTKLRQGSAGTKHW